MRATVSSLIDIPFAELTFSEQLELSKDILEERIATIISTIERKFSVVFNYSINSDSDSITITDNYKAPPSQFQHQPRVFHYNQNFSTYGCKLSRYQKHGKKIFRFEGDKTIKLRSQAFSFDIPQSNSSIFYINFDDFFNIESVLFESNSKDMGKFSFTKIKLNFDKDLILINYDYSYVELRNNIDISIKKDVNKLMSFDDEVILWQLFNHQSDAVKDLIPEYHIPSAYNFKSEEFINRLQVFSMLTL